MNAAADEFHITIRGKGGHGAYPHKAIDVIPCAAATVLALQNVAARETDPLASIVVTIGTIEGGYRNNVIADHVKMTGTLRTHDPAIRATAEDKLRRIVDGIADAYGARAQLEMIFGYPPVVNDAELAEEFAAYAIDHGFTVERPAPTMGGEDFAYFAQRVPGVMVRLGIYNEQVGSIHSGHSPQFRLDEGAIPTGIETLVAFARGVGDGSVAIPSR